MTEPGEPPGAGAMTDGEFAEAQAALLVRGACADPRPDKSDWIRVWARVRRVQGKACDADAWAEVVAAALDAGKEGA